MSTVSAPESAIDRERLEGFEDLMPFRVRDILLVSSLYDSFILREDGRLGELLIEESLELNLQQIPAITQVSTGREALELARSNRRFNLIVTNLQVGDMDAAQLAHEIKASGLDVPVVVLAYDYREVKDFIARHPVTGIERIFLWQGNARILIAIVNFIEDQRNVLHDTKAIGAPVILVVEDNIRYYSSFLPMIYTEVIHQSGRVIREGLNAAHRLMRMRARPKILLSSNYEDAAAQVNRFGDCLLGVVSDVEFPRGGDRNTGAGFALARMIRKLVPDVRVVLQSSRAEFRAQAHAEGFSFLRKRSPTFLRDLRRFLIQHCAFGDFVFRLPDGTEAGRAANLNELEDALQTVPAESIAYHGRSNHFSHWLMARTEFALAEKLRPRRVSDFATLEDLRRDMVDSIAQYRREQTQLLIGDFNAATFKAEGAFFLRMGGGSLGGKARGLAFARHLLSQHNMSRGFGDVRTQVPPTVVIGTDLFDRFLNENNLLDFAIHTKDDVDIQQRFLAAPLPRSLQQDLLAFLKEASYPLAVRSSSLLEDSQYQPFTGVYDTFMLGNHEETIDSRLQRLMAAIKRVYASTFSQNAKAYLRLTPYRVEEEKMAVLLQAVVGSAHGSRFYPDISGVMRSRNFYPIAPMRPEDGIAAVALGLGRQVVDGGKCLSFCPRYPRNILQFSTVKDILGNSQSEFWALELDHAAPVANTAENLRETRFGLDVAELDGTLSSVGSTYVGDNHAIYDGLSRNGQRVVTFAPVLKHDLFPMAAILDRLLKIGEEGLARPVEIEFAVRLPRSSGEKVEFGFLQIRPLVLSREADEVHLQEVDQSRLICESSNVLGNGRIQNLHDAVVVDFHRFERADSRQVAEDVSSFNSSLTEAGTPYLLIGVGRWGSNDPWLGIPVAWEQISGARVIVEAGFRDLRVTPSQGSHFFQNLMAFQVGYFTVNPDAGQGFMDWDWLASHAAAEERGCVRHLHFAEPLVVLMHGKTSHGMIFKSRT